MSSSPRARFLAMLGLLAACDYANARTLTAADDRRIEADVVGFEGEDKVTIRRADTGRTFTLPIDSFAEADRSALRAEAGEAAKKTPALPSGAVALELSRSKFSTRKEKQSITLISGTTRKDGITITEEDWGFSVTLRNNTTRPISGLRGEYILFVKVDAVGDDPERGDGRLKRTRGRLAFDPIPQSGKITARTQTITAVKRELANGIIWSGSGDKKTRDTLHGIWLRVYQGDTLVVESASPGTLASAQAWDAGKDS
jgi:hypothetical protein